MLFGLGGIQVEVMRDVAIRLLPVDAETAGEMVASLRGASLLGAFRGQPMRDVDALVQAMTGLSRPFIDQRGRMAEIEINPLMVLAAGHGVRAVDVRMMERKP
jgi:acyl-CoA synthetase (NDP forming)